MAPPFVFPSSLQDLEWDTDGDGDEEPSLRPQNPVTVATLRTADLEEFVNGRRRWLPWLAGRTSRQKARGSEEDVAVQIHQPFLSPKSHLVRVGFPLPDLVQSLKHGDCCVDGEDGGGHSYASSQPMGSRGQSPDPPSQLASDAFMARKMVSVPHINTLFLLV